MKRDLGVPNQRQQKTPGEHGSASVLWCWFHPHPLCHKKSRIPGHSVPSPSQSLGLNQSLESELRLVATTFSSTFQPAGWGWAGLACVRQEGHLCGIRTIAETVRCWDEEPGRWTTHRMPQKVTPADLSGQREGRQQYDSWMTG